MTKDHLYLLIPVVSVAATVVAFDAYHYQPKVQTVVERNVLTVDTRDHENRTYWDRLAAHDLTAFYRVREAIQIDANDIRCLALNIFHEAALEPFAGKVAVAQVTHNRLQNGRWGSTWCDVVYAPYQFSWTLSKRKRDMNPTGDRWQESIQAAYEYVKNGLRVHGLEESKYYHATWMERYPNWSNQMRAVREVGQHVFYVKG